MFRETYARLNHAVRPDEALVAAAVEAARAHPRRSVPAAAVRRPALAALAVCVCVLLAVPALAATVEPVYELLYQVSPAMAQFFQPVRQSDEADGIKMEVVSAYIHGSTAEIYITLQDLTGDRIDATTDLYDSYSIHRPFDSAATCRLAGYEADTKTATFLITIDEWGGREIQGDKITFSVGEFLSHKQIYEDIAIPIDLSAVTAAESIQTVSPTGGDGIGFDGERNPAALVPGAPAPQFPVDGIALTGIGYIDGALHIQTAVSDPLDNDNHGFFYLKDGEGNTVKTAYAFYFTNQAQQAERIDYRESVFDIAPERLSESTLHGSFVTSGMKTEGNWSVTFPLRQAAP